MPIKIPNNLPASQYLAQEAVPIIQEKDAIRQDIRPIRIAMLNLMPLKEVTETQFARLIGATPLQVELTLITTDTYEAKNAPKSHMQQFYKTWQSVKDDYFDGFIVTGAPVELYGYEEVEYWQELTHILQWAQQKVFSNLFICWGAQAALYHYHNINKHILPAKQFGVYDHLVHDRNNHFVRGFTEYFPCPVSRHTEVRVDDVAQNSNLHIIAASDIAGLCLVQDKKYRALYMFNHLEYDANTLAKEYYRDKEKNVAITMPHHYFPDNNPDVLPANSWKSHAHLLVGNWINDIYQNTPFHIQDIANITT